MIADSTRVVLSLCPIARLASMVHRGEDGPYDRFRPALPSFPATRQAELVATSPGIWMVHGPSSRVEIRLWEAISGSQFHETSRWDADVDNYFG